METILDYMIELGVIRVVDRAKVVTVYKDKEIIGELAISLNCPDTEGKILGLLSILTNAHEEIKYTK